MAVLHWLYCPACRWASRKDVAVDAAALPPCPRCGVTTRTDWSHGQAPATDLGSPVYYQGLEATASSSREAEKIAKKRAKAWTEEQQARGLPFSWDVAAAGDKVGGAREETRKKGRGYSYARQRSRRSSAESAA